MKITTVVGLLVSVSLLLVSYATGFYQGKKAEDSFCGDLVSGISASIRGESLPLILSAVDALTYPEQQNTRNALLRYAHIQASVVKECAASQPCASLTGQPLPSESIVQRALSYK
ncbi:MAG: hypothetical protein P4L96_04305 [Rhodoferax sp.]|nr:hypothetical protein [Rhodoferax sp.]